MANAIEIKAGEPGRLVVRLPFTAERVEKIKTVAGRRWDPAKKCWTVPNAVDMTARLLVLFAGEPVDIDPALRSGGSHLRLSRKRAVAGQGPCGDPRPAFQPEHRENPTSPGWKDSCAATAASRIRRWARRRSPISCQAWRRRRTSAPPRRTQALNALLFLFNKVLGKEIGLLGGVVRAKKAGKGSPSSSAEKKSGRSSAE